MVTRTVPALLFPSLPAAAALSLVCLLPSQLLAGEEDWTRYRGANGLGISESTAAPPVEWSESKNLKWKVALPGPGSSSPVVHGDRIFITCYSGYGAGGGTGSLKDLKRHLLSLDRESGAVLWEQTVASTGVEDAYDGFLTEHGYASSTPVTDGERVFAFFGKAGVHAYDWNGAELWHHPVGEMSSPKRWGSAASPILYGNLLIVPAADEARAVYAFDKVTGEQRWKSEGTNLEGYYGTPALMKVDDSRTDLVLAIPGEVWGMNPETGKLRWFTETDVTGNVSPGVVIDGERVVVFGGFPNTMRAAYKGGGKGEIAGKDVLLWEDNRASYLTMPVPLDGKLYWVSDSGIAYCADAESGEIVYAERLPAPQGGRGRGKPFYASPILAGGHLYAVSRTGGTFVIEARPEFKLVATNVIQDDDSLFHGTPAVSNGELFLRSNQALYCISAAE